MKYPVFVYKRIDGEETYFGLGRKAVINMMDRNKKDSTDGTAESVKKITC